MLYKIPIRFETVLEHLPIGVWLANEKGEIIYGNLAGQKIWEGARYVGPDEFHESDIERIKVFQPKEPTKDTYLCPPDLHVGTTARGIHFLYPEPGGDRHRR